MSDHTTWFYSLDGASVGPVTAEEIRAKFAAGVIGPATLCWQPEFGGEWRAVTEAGLGVQAATPVPPPPPASPPLVPSLPATSSVPASPPPRPAGPPPWPSTSPAMPYPGPGASPGAFPGASPGAFPGAPPQAGMVTEAPAWIIALVPLVSEVLGFLLDEAGVATGNAFNIGFFVATLFVMRQDIKQMLAAGVPNPPSAWWVLLPPVYLWKRSNRLGRSKSPFWVLIVTLVLSVGLIVTAASTLGSLPTPD